LTGYIQYYLGVHPNFWECNVPSNSSFGGTKKINCIFSTQGRVHAVFYKYYAELAKTFFFCLTLGQTGSGVLSDPWPLCKNEGKRVHVPPDKKTCGHADYIYILIFG
jgi:hypothetical protein